jgi:hypothetical protein
VHIVLPIYENKNNNSIFSSLNDHILEFDNHLVEFIKGIIVSYSKIRLHYFNNIFNPNIEGDSVSTET